MTNLRNMLWMARRYLTSRRHQYASFVNWVSFTGLALGVMVLTVVVSVMNGFDRELKSRLLGSIPHAVALPPPGQGFDKRYEPAFSDGVVHVTRLFQGPAMISRGGVVTDLALLGVDAGEAGGLDLIADSIVEGSLDEAFEGHGGILLGAPLARALGLGLGDAVALVLMVPAANGALPRIERFTLRATFEVGAEPDVSLAVVRFDDIERRGLAASGVAGWRLVFLDPMDVPMIEADLRAALPAGWRLMTWMDGYGELFRAVGLEKTLMFVSLALVVAIAAFNIVSGQTMLVNDKRRDIAMLTTMGAPSRFLVEVFLIQGFAVAVLAICAGLVAGVLIAWNVDPVVLAIEWLTGQNILSGTGFGRMPSVVLAGDLAVIAALSFGLCFLAVLRPALKAVDENPAQALHEG
ncbi:MAG: FtsX-like permease family protein [Gammaproteobacteria bacterium]|nr:FtsX-like permease family protein [Gammaproteobacteria bacterium]